MKQFLDVVNAVTLNQLHVGGDKMRSSSVSPSPCQAPQPGVHVHRARSMRTPARSPSDCSMTGHARPRPRRARPRPRSHSRGSHTGGGHGGGLGGLGAYYTFPSSSSDDEDDARDVYLLRNFAITGKGVVNRGDSVKSRRSSADSADCPSPAERSRSPTKIIDTRVPLGDPHRYHVVILGAQGVGKSSLVQQFSTSDFLHAYCASPEDDAHERSVNVLLDGEESELSFLEQHDADVNGDYESEPQAFCVVFAATERASFRLALQALERLWQSETVGTKAVILVANKTDLVRGRTVSTEEAKAAATQYDCKYIETSVAINHNVDELLVGLLTQIRLKLKDPEKSRSIFRKRSFSRRKSLGKLALPDTRADAALEPTDVMSRASTRAEPAAPRKLYRGSKTSASFRMKSLLDRVLARDSKAKSCEKLHVL